MIDEICAEIRNYFTRSAGDIHSGTFTISNGQIEPLPFISEGQFYRITGSKFNSGVHMYPTYDLQDETFTGQIWAMFVPTTFVKLCEQIGEWCTNNAAQLDSPYTSENYAVYSYTKRTGAGGGAYTWQDHFAKRLNPYRKACL